MLDTHFIPGSPDTPPGEQTALQTSSLTGIIGEHETWMARSDISPRQKAEHVRTQIGALVGTIGKATVLLGHWLLLAQQRRLYLEDQCSDVYEWACSHICDIREVYEQAVTRFRLYVMLREYGYTEDTVDSLTRVKIPLLFRELQDAHRQIESTCEDMRRKRLTPEEQEKVFAQHRHDMQAKLGSIISMRDTDLIDAKRRQIGKKVQAKAFWTDIQVRPSPWGGEQYIGVLSLPADPDLLERLSRAIKSFLYVDCQPHGKAEHYTLEKVSLVFGEEADEDAMSE